MLSKKFSLSMAILFVFSTIYPLSRSAESRLYTADVVSIFVLILAFAPAFILNNKHNNDNMFFITLPIFVPLGLFLGSIQYILAWNQYPDVGIFEARFTMFTSASVFLVFMSTLFGAPIDFQKLIRFVRRVEENKPDMKLPTHTQEYHDSLASTPFLLG